jgi:hypothetical protein
MWLKWGTPIIAMHPGVNMRKNCEADHGAIASLRMSSAAVRRCAILLVKVLTLGRARDYIPAVRRAVRFTVRLRAFEAPH